MALTSLNEPEVESIPLNSDQFPPGGGWHDGPVTTPEAPALVADCSQCFALCCVVPAFTASADFAITKPAGRPCLNLARDDRCTIHARTDFPKEERRLLRRCTVEGEPLHE